MTLQTAGTAGAFFPSELSISRDPISGATVRQYTNYMAHSHHFYFTHPHWYDNGRKMVIVSDRGNRRNLFGVNLETGELRQLTDWDPALPGRSFCKNPVREEIYCKLGLDLIALDLNTLETRVIFTYPERYNASSADVTADGRYVVAGATEDLSHRFQVDLQHGYVGFNEIHDAKPQSFIWKIPVDGGKASVLLEERYWLGHFNTSKTVANIMTFCHEGPWERVDNRIWGLDIESGRAWKIRQTVPGERVGHEYWMSDGERIGYHGANQQGWFYGSIRYDNTDLIDAPFTGRSTHFHSQTLDLIIGDGSPYEPYLLAWRFRNNVFEGPKVLAWHRASFHAQQLHVHPCVYANGARVLYTADPQAYGQVFIVDVPEWDALPDRSAVTKNREG